MSKRDLEVNLEKVRAILTLMAPMHVQEIRGFLGCVGYHRQFIDGYASKAIPLTELLKKNMEFSWSPERQGAIEEFKLTLVKAPILSPPD